MVISSAAGSWFACWNENIEGQVDVCLDTSTEIARRRLHYYVFLTHFCFHISLSKNKKQETTKRKHTHVYKIHHYCTLAFGETVRVALSPCRSRTEEKKTTKGCAGEENVNVRIDFRRKVTQTSPILCLRYRTVGGVC